MRCHLRYHRLRMKNAPPPAGPEKNAPKGGCFPVRWDRILASMSETDWSDLDVTELLPTGTVTLLLADVEGSTQLWESQPTAMTAAIARLNRTAVEAHCRARRRPPGRAGRGRQLRGRIRARQRRGGVRAGSAAAPNWRRSSCASACTPAKCSCATRATTRARRSTRPPGCAIWRTAARPSCRRPPRKWSRTGCRTMRG